MLSTLGIMWLKFKLTSRLSVILSMRNTLAGCILLVTGFLSCSKIGKPAPSFSFTSINNEVIDSETLKSKIIVVNVWATWCHTCIKEIPDLNRLQAKYAEDTSVVFIGLSDKYCPNLDCRSVMFKSVFVNLNSCTMATPTGLNSLL